MKKTLISIADITFRLITIGALSAGTDYLNGRKREATQNLNGRLERGIKEKVVPKAQETFSNFKLFDGGRK